MKYLKPTIIIIAIVIALIFVFFVSFISTKSNSEATEETNDIITKATKESGEIKKNEEKDYNEISVSTYLDLYKASSNSIVLIGNGECSYCKIAGPILKHIAYLYNLTINYLNTDNFTKEDNENLLNSDSFYQNGIGTPLILVIGNSTIVGHVDGLNITANYIEFFKTYGLIKE